MLINDTLEYTAGGAPLQMTSAMPRIGLYAFPLRSMSIRAAQGVDDASNDGPVAENAKDLKVHEARNTQPHSDRMPLHHANHDLGSSTRPMAPRRHPVAAHLLRHHPGMQSAGN